MGYATNIGGVFWGGGEFFWGGGEFFFGGGEALGRDGGLDEAAEGE
jgi:hypothetical protein